jgi:hypothetical protein
MYQTIFELLFNPFKVFLYNLVKDFIHINFQIVFLMPNY